VSANAEAGDILRKPRRSTIPNPNSRAAVRGRVADFISRATIARNDEGAASCRKASDCIPITPDPVVPPFHPAAAHLGCGAACEAAKMGECKTPDDFRPLSALASTGLVTGIVKICCPVRLVARQ
jgi:hypothetical protein